MIDTLAPQNLVNTVVQYTLLIALAPLLQGLMKRLRARLQGRPGPSPLQPYRDLAKYWSKESLVASGTSALVVATPGILAGIAVTFAALVPSLFGHAWSPTDAVALALLLALGRFVLVLSALDTRSAFEGMAASRETTFAALTEAPLLIALFSAGLGAFGPHPPPHDDVARLAGVLTTAALLLVMLSETARIPVDNQETHYELTMIHEGLILEYSGRHLALLQFAAYVRQAAFFILAASMLPGEGFASLAWLGVLIVVIPLTERTFAKMRFFEVPQIFASAFVLALTSIGLRVLGIGAW